MQSVINAILHIFVLNEIYILLYKQIWIYYFVVHHFDQTSETN
jgi:hypothetical protein